MRNYSAGRKILNSAFALLFGASAACNIGKAIHGDLEFEGYVNNGQDRVDYNEGVAMPLGMPRANRMVTPLQGRVFTLYDVKDRIQVADPRDARLERICIGDGSRDLPCYRTDGSEYFKENFLISTKVTGQEEADIRDLFDAGNARYNQNRPDIAKQLAAQGANKVNALKP